MSKRDVGFLRQSITVEEVIVVVKGVGIVPIDRMKISVPKVQTQCILSHHLLESMRRVQKTSSSRTHEQQVNP